MSTAAPPGAKPPDRREDAESVIATLTAAGHVAMLAGGCVRDQLLGLEPKDFDVATDAAPDAIRRLFRQTQAVGAAFGVMLLRMGQSTIEVARFRSDGTYLDGRHPSSVTFATPKEDAQRRDFTINGLFYDIALRRVIDYVGGEADLRAGVLRAIGDPSQRFAEDHLRLLRAVRFAARFGLTIDFATADAMAASAPQLMSISPERIAQELRMMLTPPTRRLAWELLRRFKLDAVIFRFAPPATAAEWPYVPLEDAEALLPQVLAGQVFLRHGIEEWCDTLRNEYRRGLRLTLRWSNQEAAIFDILLERTVRAASGPVSLALKRRWTDDGKAMLTQGKVERQGETLTTTFIGVCDMHRRLFRALSTVHDRLRPLADFAEELGDLLTTPNPPPLISGDDLLAAGLRPGPAFKAALAAVYDEQLEGRIKNKAAARAFAIAKATTPASG